MGHYNIYLKYSSLPRGYSVIEGYEDSEIGMLHKTFFCQQAEDLSCWGIFCQHGSEKTFRTTEPIYKEAIKEAHHLAKTFAIELQKSKDPDLRVGLIDKFEDNFN